MFLTFLGASLVALGLIAARVVSHREQLAIWRCRRYHRLGVS